MSTISILITSGISIFLANFYCVSMNTLFGTCTILLGTYYLTKYTSSLKQNTIYNQHLLIDSNESVNIDYPFEYGSYVSVLTIDDTEFIRFFSLNERYPKGFKVLGMVPEYNIDITVDPKHNKKLIIKAGYIDEPCIVSISLKELM